HALAATAAQEEREHVADDRREAGQGDGGRGEAQPPAEPEGDEPFGRVCEQDSDRPCFAESARDVGGADVAAADLAEIDALGARDDDAEGDRAGEVGTEAEAEAGKEGVHETMDAGAAGRTRAQKAATSSSDSVRGQSGGRLARRVAP